MKSNFANFCRNLNVSNNGIIWILMYSPLWVVRSRGHVRTHYSQSSKLCCTYSLMRYSHHQERPSGRAAHRRYEEDRANKGLRIKECQSSGASINKNKKEKPPPCWRKGKRRKRKADSLCLACTLCHAVQMMQHKWDPAKQPLPAGARSASCNVNLNVVQTVVVAAPRCLSMSRAQ